MQQYDGPQASHAHPAGPSTVLQSPTRDRQPLTNGAYRERAASASESRPESKDVCFPLTSTLPVSNLEADKGPRKQSNVFREYSRSLQQRALTSQDYRSKV